MLWLRWKTCVRVVAALDVAQPPVIGAVGGLDRVVGLVVAEVVEPGAGRDAGLQSGERLAGPADVGAGRRGSVHTDGIRRFQPRARCRSTAVSMSPSGRPRVKLESQ